MKKIILTTAALLLTVTPVMAKNIKVEAMSDFSTANPPATWQLRVAEQATSDDGYVIECGSIIDGKITDVESPKRLKRNASFVFIPTTYHDAKTGETYKIEKDLTGKYSTMSDISVAKVAKQGAVAVGNHFLDGVLGPGVALVEGAVKNEHGNRAKSAVVSVYESTPLSYANKGKEINIPKGTVFIMSFKGSKETTKQEPNYTYEMKDEK